MNLKQTVQQLQPKKKQKDEVVNNQVVYFYFYSAKKGPKLNLKITDKTWFEECFSKIFMCEEPDIFFSVNIFSIGNSTKLHSFIKKCQALKKLPSFILCIQ